MVGILLRLSLYSKVSNNLKPTFGKFIVSLQVQDCFGGRTLIRMSKKVEGDHKHLV